MRHLLAMIVLGLAATTEAAEMRLPPCPNKNIEAFVKTGENAPMDAEVVFRYKITKKKLGSYKLGRYENNDVFMWSPDGKYAALQTHFSRWTSELLVVSVSNDRVQEVKVQDFTQNIYGRFEVLHGGRIRCDKPLKWLNPDHLLISAIGTVGDPKESGYDYEVEISMSGLPLEGWLEKITCSHSHEQP